MFSALQFRGLNPSKPSDKIDQDDDDLKIVLPGETITTDSQFMRGHGTYEQSSDSTSLVASVAGTVERVNKLVSVRPSRARFNGEIGDVVVGRITEVGQKRWKVDINARQDAVLLLSSVNLPGGVQRRKTELDELSMRSFFTDGHLLSAEVQNFFQDGAASLHTRSLKYGKLRNGSLVTVPASLIKRSKSHFTTLSCGVDLILGVNGYVWVSKHVEPTSTEDPTALYSDENQDISPSMRETIARVCNCITILARHNSLISETMIVYALEGSQSFSVKEMINAEIASQIVQYAKTQIEENA